MEEILAPIALQRVVAVENFVELGLNEILESQVFGKTPQFIFSHFCGLILFFIFDLDTDARHAENRLRRLDLEEVCSLAG